MGASCDIESILKIEIETCPEVDAIEREMIENELLRYLAYIHNYLEQERNEIQQPINETLQEINETPSVNNPKGPDLIRKNIFERGINKFLKIRSRILKLEIKSVPLVMIYKNC